MATLTISLLLGIILYFAGKKAFADLRAGKCASCSASCSKRNKQIEPLPVQLDVTFQKN